jgi:hypothetical protein
MTSPQVSSHSPNRNLADYYHWRETDKGIRIYVHSGMIDRLQADVLRGAEAGPDGAREVGGILLGTAYEDRGTPIVIIDDFVPVPCSYSGGPLYLLSDADTPGLEAVLLRAALAGCESPDAPSILGYYRSHMRDGLSLSSSDLRLIDSYFQTPDNVFLLVKTVAGTKACTAGFFFWEDGGIQSEFSALEVALGRTPQSSPRDLGSVTDRSATLDDDLPAALDDVVNDDLPADLTDLFAKAALPESSNVPTPAPKSSDPSPVQPAAQSPAVESVPPTQGRTTAHAWRGLLLRAATIVIATVALVISVVNYLSNRPPHQEAASLLPSASMLGLQVEANPPDLLLKWNRNARVVVAAQRATLSIRDGKLEKTVDLNKIGLARGSYLHKAASEDIQFRLEVYGADNASVAQSIRIALPDAAQPRS